MVVGTVGQEGGEGEQEGTEKGEQEEDQTTELRKSSVKQIGTLELTVETPTLSLCCHDTQHTTICIWCKRINNLWYHCAASTNEIILYAI